MEQAQYDFSPRTWAEISRANLRHNFEIIKKDAGGTRVCCVVKADAYGHGADTVVRVLRDEGADCFAVSSVREAAEVRAILGEKETPILILGYTCPEHVPFLLKENVSQALLSPAYAEALATAIPAGQRLSVHPAIDTGMNRIGFLPSETDALADVFSQPCFSADGIFTHFVLADEPDLPHTDLQYEKMRAVLDALTERGIPLPPVHVCNSAGISAFPGYHCDMVRAGISLYGLMPSAHTSVEGLRPVMTLKTILSHVHTVSKGETVGYGATFTADRDLRVGTLPVGYADGFLRSYAKDGYVIIGERRAPILGRICMDQCMVDLSDVPDAKIGDEIILFGDGALTADTLAARAETIGYEVVCLITKRVPRIAVD